MKLMLYSWNSNNERILEENLTKFGFEVVWFSKTCSHYTRDLELAAAMIPFIHKEKVEAVISFNYFPIISMVCDTCKIPYYAWVYDSPHLTLYAKQITLPCNHIGIFDREMVRQLQEKGVETAYHVPLSVDTEYFGRMIRQTPAKKTECYESDISFVGSMYTDRHNYYDLLLEGHDREVFDRVIQRQCFVYDKNYLHDELMAGRLDLTRIRERMEQEGLMLGEDYFAKAEEIMQAVVLEKKVTVEERGRLLNRVAEMFGNQYRFNLYTGSDLGKYPRLKKHSRGVVDYHRRMPLVFAKSRINLNVSLRSIHSGIPLRVLDIMACGGFVLTNYQPEIEECFEAGKELETFKSMEECMDKIAYYLAHDRERNRIAGKGQQSVQEKFGYTNGLTKLFEVS